MFLSVTVLPGCKYSTNHGWACSGFAYTCGPDMSVSLRGNTLNLPEKDETKVKAKIFGLTK